MAMGTNFARGINMTLSTLLIVYLLARTWNAICSRIFPTPYNGYHTTSMISLVPSFLRSSKKKTPSGNVFFYKYPGPDRSPTNGTVAKSIRTIFQYVFISMLWRSIRFYHLAYRKPLHSLLVTTKSANYLSQGGKYRHQRYQQAHIRLPFPKPSPVSILNYKRVLLPSLIFSLTVAIILILFLLSQSRLSSSAT